MWPSLRHGAIMIMLALCVGLAAAGFRGASDGGDDGLMNDSTGSIGDTPRGALRLSDEQRFRIYDGVMRIPDAPVADVPPPELADALPGGVAMHDLPGSVIRAVPLVNDHKFVKLDDRILVVDPANRMVVAMIPRYRLLP
jgi:hypothetical protein